MINETSVEKILGAKSAIEKLHKNGGVKTKTT